MRHSLAEFGREFDRLDESFATRAEPVKELPLSSRIYESDRRRRRCWDFGNTACIHPGVAEHVHYKTARIVVSDRAEKAHGHAQNRQSARRIRAVAARATLDRINERGSSAPVQLIDGLHQSVVYDIAAANNTRPRPLHNAILFHKLSCAFDGTLLHGTCSTRPTISPHASAPVITITPVTTNAGLEEPLVRTAKPATSGATTPARLAIPFCTLVHRPAISGPAKVCVIAHRFEQYKPNATHATTSSAMHAFSLLTNATGSRTPEPINPPTTKDFLTSV